MELKNEMYKVKAVGAFTGLLNSLYQKEQAHLFYRPDTVSITCNGLLIKNYIRSLAIPGVIR